jgi:sortase A
MQTENCKASQFSRSSQFALLNSHFAVCTSVFFFVASIALLARPVFHFALRTVNQWRAQRAWSEYRQSALQSTGCGAPAAWLCVPSAGIDTLVIHGATARNLQRLPCLAAEGQDFDAHHGMRIVTAHRDTHFRALDRTDVGDIVNVETPRGVRLTYRISDKEVLPKENVATRLASHRTGEWLVLMTCYPFRWIGPAPDRILFWAEPVQRSIANRVTAREAMELGTHLHSPAPGTAPAWPPSAVESADGPRDPRRSAAGCPRG